MEDLFIDHHVFYIKYDSLSALEPFFLLYHLRFYRMLVFNPGRRVPRTLFLDRL